MPLDPNAVERIQFLLLVRGPTVSTLKDQQELLNFLMAVTKDDALYTYAVQVAGEDNVYMANILEKFFPRLSTELLPMIYTLNNQMIAQLIAAHKATSTKRKIFNYEDEIRALANYCCDSVSKNDLKSIFNYYRILLNGPEENKNFTDGFVAKMRQRHPAKANPALEQSSDLDSQNTVSDAESEPDEPAKKKQKMCDTTATQYMFSNAVQMVMLQDDNTHPFAVPSIQGRISLRSIVNSNPIIPAALQVQNLKSLLNNKSESRDGFFQAVAAILNLTARVGSVYDAFTLRCSCDLYINNPTKNAWLKAAIEQRGENYAEYKKNILATDETLPQPGVVNSNHLIEGRMLCDELNIRIHLILMIPQTNNNTEDDYKANHLLIDKHSVKPVENPNTIDYKDPNIIHLMSENMRYFAPNYPAKAKTGLTLKRM